MIRSPSVTDEVGEIAITAKAAMRLRKVLAEADRYAGAHDLALKLDAHLRDIIGDALPLEAASAAIFGVARAVIEHHEHEDDGDGLTQNSNQGE